MIYTTEYQNDLRKVLKDLPDLNLHLNAEKRILITGASGLIGSAITDLLLASGTGVQLYLAGRSVERMGARFSPYREGEDFYFVPFDATDPEHTPLPDVSFDYCIYGAANADPAAIMNAPVETMTIAIQGLYHVLEHLRIHSAGRTTRPRLLSISSSEVYGNRTDEGEKATPFSETDYGYVDLLNPRACYPVAKRAAETLCISYTEQYPVDTVIVRPGHIYGPMMTAQDSHASAQFARQAAAGEPIVMKSAGTQLRSYVHALDCASAILTVLLRGESVSAYNISHEDAVVSIREMAQAFADAGGVELVMECTTEAEQKSYNLMDNSSLNADRLLALGWKPCFSMQEGAKETVRVLRTH